MKNAKIKKFDELSKDIEDKALEVDFEKIKSGEFEIESVIDVIIGSDSGISENISISGIDLSNRDVKRGDTLYITCLMKKKGVSFSSPSSQYTLKVRIVEMISGWSYLNKIINK